MLVSRTSAGAPVLSRSISATAATFSAADGSLPVFPRADVIDPAELIEFVRDGIWWYTTDEEILIDQEIVNRAFIQTTDPRSTHYATARHQDIAPEHLFGRRLELLTLAVLGQLEATSNWHRVAREWMYGDAPVTELGRAEAAYLAVG